MINPKLILILKNLLLFAVITIMLLIILSFTMLYVDFNDITLNIVVQVVKTTVIFFCGARIACIIHQSGFLMGAISGLLLTLIILLINIIFISTSINIIHLLIQLLFGTLIGTGGGIVGVNMLKKE